MVNPRKTAAFSALALLVVLATWWWVSRDWEAPIVVPARERPSPAHAVQALPAPQPQQVAELPSTADGTGVAPPARTPADSAPAPEAHDAAPEVHALSGRVVDARGKPLAGHVVRLSDPPGTMPTAGTTTRALEATTDA